MKERPILFSAPMVRALLDGSKTQTRRVVKGSDAWPTNTHHAAMLETRGTAMAVDSNRCSYGPEIKCPYGKPGDQLWVRETWAHDAESLEQCRASHEDAFGGSYGPYYRATEVAPETLHWKPSIHMPRWASRITLALTGVRVERLHDITADEAFKEGVKITLDAETKTPLVRVSGQYPPAQYINGFGLVIAEYASLWESINGPGSWAANPWVWVIEFKVIKP